MADYFWCHCPQCHTRATQDRVRGSKGSKVLRTRKIKQHTKRKVEFRNKPRPDNKWWNKPISEDLKTSSALVTNMSLTAIDALVNGVPCIVDKGNVCSSISSTSYEDINNLKMPSKDDVLTWGFKSANCQFTINEVESGEFYEYLK